MLELEEYKQVPRKGLLCEKVNKELMLEKARTPEVRSKCEALLKSKNIDYGFINPTVEPKISKECNGMFEYDIVCKYIDKSGVYKENFNTGVDYQGSCGRFMLFLIIVIGLYLIIKY